MFVGFFIFFVGYSIQYIVLQNFWDRKKILNIELRRIIELSMGTVSGPADNIELGRLLN